MNILGIDPGATSGWCLYSTIHRSVTDCGQFPEHRLSAESVAAAGVADVVVVERPKGYGPTRPQLVDCGYVAGRIIERLAAEHDVREMLRLEVCRELTEAVHGVVRVRSDATAWAALLEIHGGADAAAKKPRRGPLAGVRSHERAALAVAVAFALRAEKPPSAAQ